MADLLKFKRQVRDFFNKNTHDEATINAVADVIGFVPPENKKIMCCCCGRQIVSYPADDPYTIGGKPATAGFGDQYFCHRCAEDLDEDGLFPEERG